MDPDPNGADLIWSVDPDRNPDPRKTKRPPQKCRSFKEADISDKLEASSRL
jgi:hypothetical protein